jgi:two-component system chemotaxis response regulator CheY
MTILVVDDSITMRRIITNMLRAAGYETIIEAGNGQEALSLMAGVNLVLTDWNMPVMDGLTLLKEIRKNGDWAKIPVIMVTTEGAQNEVLEALRNGANDYIVKPFNGPVFTKKVENIISTIK